MSEKIAKIFRLNQETISKLESIAESYKCSQTAAVIKAIDALYEDRESKESDDKVLNVLIEQIDTKDKQIERLQEALKRSQEATQASQVLQAQNNLLESAEHKSKRFNWFRLKRR